MTPASSSDEQLSERILESATDFAIVTTDREGRVTNWNAGAQQIMQWSQAEMTGQSVERIFTAEDRVVGRVDAEMRHALEHGRANDERWHVRKDGARFWASGEMMPLRSGGGEHLGFVKILRDRTDAHQAGLALREAEANLRRAQEAGGVGVFWVDTADNLLHASPEFCRLYGLPDRDVYPPEAFEALVLDEDRHLVSTTKSRAEGEVHLCAQYRIARADDGSIRWIERRGELEVGPRGRRFVGAARDITEQVKATKTLFSEAALRESEESYRTLFESMDDGFCILEMIFDDQDRPVDYRFIETNEVFARQTGLVDARGRTARELVPNLEPVWFEMYGKVASTGETLRFVDHSKPMGRWFDVAAFRTGDPRRRRVALIFNDITEQRTNDTHQAALLRLADRIRDLDAPDEIARTACEVLGGTLEASIAGFGAVDATESVLLDGVWARPGTPELVGSRRIGDFGTYVEDLRARKTVAISDVRRDPRTKARSQELEGNSARAFINVPIFEGGRFVAMQFVLDTEPRQWTASEVALTKEFAERTRVAVERARSDIERRRQAAALAELNNGLERQVAERTADRNALWQLSQDIMLRSTFDGRITAVNPAWTEILGWREDELLGSNLFDFIHPEDMERTVRAAGELAVGTSHARFDNRYRARDGSYRWISWSTRPGDELINAVGRDITSEKDAAEALLRSEEALRQSQKMEAVGQLTGGLAHDFNNLLAGITGALELMQRRMLQGKTSDLDRYIGIARGAAKRAAALTHRLLAFSRRQTLDPKATDANRLIAGMEELVRRTIGPAIDLEVVSAGGLWPTFIDPFQLENALLNLCINARDAMPDGGRITIETANRWLDERGARERQLEPGQYISVCVTDTGTGMAPEVAARIFEPFFTTKPLGQGTGLGLSMIYGFVQQSGGQVRVYSELGQGTTMCLYLPRHHEGEGELEAPLGADAPRSKDGETVLVVDDEPTVRLLVTEILDELGYAAIEAEDGPSASERPVRPS